MSSDSPSSGEPRHRLILFPPRNNDKQQQEKSSTLKLRCWFQDSPRSPSLLSRLLHYFPFSFRSIHSSFCRPLGPHFLISSLNKEGEIGLKITKQKQAPCGEREHFPLPLLLLLATWIIKSIETDWQQKSRIYCYVHGNLTDVTVRHPPVWEIQRQEGNIDT